MPHSVPALILLALVSRVCKFPDSICILYGTYILPADVPGLEYLLPEGLSPFYDPDPSSGLLTEVPLYMDASGGQTWLWKMQALQYFQGT